MSFASTADRRPFNRFSREELTKQRERELMKECTFKPKTNSHSSSRNRTARGTSRVDELAKPRRQESEEAARRRREEAEKAKCTFKPKINPYHGSSRSRRRSHSRDGRCSSPECRRSGSRSARRSTREDRIAQLAQPKVIDAEAERRRLEAEVNKHSFRPAINPDTEAILDMSQYRPIHERLGALQRARCETLARLRVEAETSNPELTFRPNINPDSERIAELSPSRTKGITSRLTKDAEDSRRRRAQRKQAWEKDFAATHSFAPQMSRESERIVEEHPHLSETDFLERQRRFARAKQARQEEAKHAEAKECTFHPSVKGAAEVLAVTRPERAMETLEDKVYRLSKLDAQRVEVSRQKREEEYYSQYKFEPKLNALSKSMGRPTPMDELTRHDGGKEARRKAEEEKERKFREECTFQPALVASGSGVPARAPLHIKSASDPRHISERVDAYIAERAARLAQARRELEYEQLRGCTFEPDVDPTVPVSDAPVVVRGLGRFLEGKELAKRLEMEQKEREAKAFSVRGAKKTVPGPPTVPEPFALSTDPRLAARRRRLREEQQERELRECTFRPRTTEGLNHMLLQQLLLMDR